MATGACHGPVVRSGPVRAVKIRKCDHLLKIGGPGRAAAHEMWALYGPLHPAHKAAHVFSRAGPAATNEMRCTTATTTTTSILPMTRPTCFHGLARAAAHEMVVYVYTINTTAVLYSTE